MSIFTSPGLSPGCGFTLICTGCAPGGTPAGSDCAGADVFTGAVLAGAVSSTDVPSPAFRVARIESESEVTMNNTAEMVVAFESSVADPRGPKAG